MAKNELMHYGVIGMKWGIKKARYNEEKARILKSKGKNERANKYENKAKNILKKHEKRSSKETLKRIEKTSTAKLYIESVLLGGTYGALKYNEARAKGQTRGKSIATGTLYSLGNLATDGLLSIIEPRVRKNT